MDNSVINKEKCIGIVLLAAGNSTRLGRPKQLLPYLHQSLLQYSLKAALASEASDVTLVLGAHAATIKNNLDGFDLNIVLNTNWQEGMASSIRCGIEEIIKINPLVEGVIIMVCDQPYITTALLNKLIATHAETEKEIVPSSYENIFGTPVLFHRSLFKELLQLRGDMGAKKLMRKYADKIAAVSFPEGKTDIDTELDYQQLSKGNID